MDARFRPVTYHLKNLIGEEEPGSWYRQNLIRAPSPDRSLFTVNEVFDTRINPQGETEYLVNYRNWIIYAYGERLTSPTNITRIGILVSIEIRINSY